MLAPTAAPACTAPANWTISAHGAVAFARARWYETRSVAFVPVLSPDTCTTEPFTLTTAPCTGGSSVAAIRFCGCARSKSAPLAARTLTFHARVLLSAPMDFTGDAATAKGATPLGTRRSPAPGPNVRASVSGSTNRRVVYRYRSVAGSGRAWCG
jgi:hypothetical protein